MTLNLSGFKVGFSIISGWMVGMILYVEFHGQIGIFDVGKGETTIV